MEFLNGEPMKSAIAKLIIGSHGAGYTEIMAVGPRGLEPAAVVLTEAEAAMLVNEINRRLGGQWGAWSQVLASIEQD